MKVKVLESFRDKNNLNLIHWKGDIFECTEERYKEILKKGKYVEQHSESEQEPKAEQHSESEQEPKVEQHSEYEKESEVAPAQLAKKTGNRKKAEK